MELSHLQSKLETYQNEDLIALATKRLRISRLVAEKNFLEMKKLLLIIFLVQEKKVGVQNFALFKQMQSIDDLWHLFILMTREYSSFCHEIFGVYLHHEPEIERLGQDHVAPLALNLRAQIALVEEVWGNATMNTWYLPIPAIRQNFFEKWLAPKTLA